MGLSLARDGSMAAYAHMTTTICRVLMGLAVLWGILGLAGGRSWASDSELDRATGRGMHGVEVTVADIKPEGEGAGLTRYQLQTDVEWQLRQAGIPLVSS